MDSRSGVAEATKLRMGGSQLLKCSFEFFRPELQGWKTVLFEIQPGLIANETTQKLCEYHF